MLTSRQRWNTDNVCTKQQSIKQIGQQLSAWFGFNISKSVHYSIDIMTLDDMSLHVSI
jgi:hypothetical protein